MSTAPVAISAANRSRLFFAAALALTMSGINASFRANTAADLQRVFLDPVDKLHSASMIATILGLPFLGYAVTIASSSFMPMASSSGLLIAMVTA